MGAEPRSRMRAWYNGRIVDVDQPVLSVLDHGITVGDGVFEVAKVIDNVPFAMTRHLQRMARSAAGLGLPEPDLDLVRKAVDETLAGMDMTFGRVRWTFTAGVSPLGSGRESEEPTLLVIATPQDRPATSTAAVTVPWPRNERGALAGLKTTSYAENVVALARAHEHDATEAIFSNTQGWLCEGTGSNVFCVFGYEVVTPPLSVGCLAGITRKLLVEWYDVAERDLPMSALAEADEVFLTSTVRDVQAVHTLDGRRLPDPGPVTQAVMQVWRQREEESVDP